MLCVRGVGVCGGGLRAFLCMPLCYLHTSTEVQVCMHALTGTHGCDQHARKHARFRMKGLGFRV